MHKIDNTRATISISLDPALKAQAQALAERRGHSISSLCRLLLREEIERSQPKPDAPGQQILEVAR
jgi:predicted transcriptional regulator